MIMASASSSAIFNHLAAKAKTIGGRRALQAARSPRKTTADWRCAQSLWPDFGRN
jgi:hypothetical protein